MCHQIETLAAGRDGKLPKHFNQYAARCAQANVYFTPFIMETSGYLHPEARKLIKQLASLAAEMRKIPKNVIYRYFLKSLSCKHKQLCSTLFRRRIAQINSPFPLSQSNFTEGMQTITDIDRLQENSTDIFEDLQEDVLNDAEENN